VDLPGASFLRRLLSEKGAPGRDCSRLHWAQQRVIRVQPKHLAIDCRPRCGPPTQPKGRALFSRGSLWETDRGADKVAFGKLDAAIAQNIVSGRVMKIKIG
jgi:hypothetical protein